MKDNIYKDIKKVFVKDSLKLIEKGKEFPLIDFRWAIYKIGNTEKHSLDLQYVFHGKLYVADNKYKSLSDAYKALDKTRLAMQIRESEEERWRSAGR